MAYLEFEELCAHIEDEMGAAAGGAAGNGGTDKVSFTSLVGNPAAVISKSYFLFIRDV